VTGYRLYFAVHLDDNFGSHDSHLLPFDGTVNWNKVAAGLRKSRGIGF